MNYEKIITDDFKAVKLPFEKNEGNKYKKGALLALTGEILVCRDMVHKKIAELYIAKKKMPVDFSNAVVFYAGPSPTTPGKVTGSIGPTTSARMDKYTDIMLKLGVRAFIGKGPRSAETNDLIKKNNALYLVTFGGYAALLAQFVIKSETLAFDELGAEALLKLEVARFPVVVN